MKNKILIIFFILSFPLIVSKLIEIEIVKLIIKILNLKCKLIYPKINRFLIYKRSRHHAVY